ASAAPGTYAIVPSAATGRGLSNYTINYANGTLSVTPAPTPSPSPTPTPTPAPPAFVGEHRTIVKIKKKKVTEFVLTFTEPLSTPGGVYQVTQAGKPKKSAHKPVQVKSTTLGPGGTSVILSLGRYTAGKPLTLTASGLTGANGAPVKSFVTGL